MDAWIEVNRRELEASLRSLERLVKGTPHDMAAITYEDGHLVMKCGGAAMAVPATGNWTKRASIPAAMLLQLRSTLPAAESVRLEVDAGKMRVGSLRFNCSWTPLPKTIVDIPLNPPLPYLLAIERAFSAAEISDNGIEKVVETAVARRERLLEAVTAPLGELGVPEVAIRELVEAHLPAMNREVDLSAFRPSQSELPMEIDGEQLDLAGE